MALEAHLIERQLTDSALNEGASEGLLLASGWVRFLPLVHDLLLVQEDVRHQRLRPEASVSGDRLCYAW